MIARLSHWGINFLLTALQWSCLEVYYYLIRGTSVWLKNGVCTGLLKLSIAILSLSLSIFHVAFHTLNLNHSSGTFSWPGLFNDLTGNNPVVDLYPTTFGLVFCSGCSFLPCTEPYLSCTWPVYSDKEMKIKLPWLYNAEESWSKNTQDISNSVTGCLWLLTIRLSILQTKHFI